VHIGPASPFTEDDRRVRGAEGDVARLNEFFATARMRNTRKNISTLRAPPSSTEKPTLFLPTCKDPKFDGTLAGGGPVLLQYGPEGHNHNGEDSGRDSTRVKQFSRAFAERVTAATASCFGGWLIELRWKKSPRPERDLRSRERAGRSASTRNQPAGSELALPAANAKDRADLGSR